MAIQKELAQRLGNRIGRAQRFVQKLMEQKAEEIGLVLLTINAMIVLRPNEKIAIANILPSNSPQTGALEDFALLYLDLPIVGFVAGFYKLQLSNDTTMPGAILVDLDNQPVGRTAYHAVDFFASVVGAKQVPAQQLPIFETFNKSNDAYVIGGVHADGQAFAIVLEF